MAGGGVERERARAGLGEEEGARERAVLRQRRAAVDRPGLGGSEGDGRVNLRGEVRGEAAAIECQAVGAGTTGQRVAGRGEGQRVGGDGGSERDGAAGAAEDGVIGPSQRDLGHIETRVPVQENVAPGAVATGAQTVAVRDDVGRSTIPVKRRRTRLRRQRDPGRDQKGTYEMLACGVTHAAGYGLHSADD